jgi:hypothetical protein
MLGCLNFRLASIYIKLVGFQIIISPARKGSKSRRPLVSEKMGLFLAVSFEVSFCVCRCSRAFRIAPVGLAIVSSRH